MAKHSKPRAGSLAYAPRKRAKKEIPRIHSWPDTTEAGVLGFAGYKVGMTNVLAFDHRKTCSTHGLEIFIPVTILEVPSLSVAAIRFYKPGYHGLTTYTDVFSDNLSEDLRKRININPEKTDTEKKLSRVEKELSDIADIRLIVYTQPRLTSLSKKVPDIMEVCIGGGINEKFAYARGKIGRNIPVSEVFKENQYVDVTAVTKGKGFQGVIKRFGIRKQPRKAGKGRRHIGSGGAWTPTRKLWKEPLPGQMGYHSRTEYNKVLMQIGDDGDKVTPKGGFLRYGGVKKDYVLIKGSVPGPSKRLIRLTQPKRPRGESNFEITHINLSSKQR